MINASDSHRVLVIGNGESAELVRAVIEESFIEAIHVRSADASVAIRVLAFDLVVLDCDDQDPFGRELIRALRGEKAPIILLTHYRVDRLLRRQLSEGGVSWILEKPVVVTSLPKLFRYALESKSQPSRYVEMGETASAMMVAVA